MGNFLILIRFSLNQPPSSCMTCSAKFHYGKRILNCLLIDSSWWYLHRSQPAMLPEHLNRYIYFTVSCEILQGTILLKATITALVSHQTSITPHYVSGIAPSLSVHPGRKYLSLSSSVHFLCTQVSVRGSTRSYEHIKMSTWKCFPSHSSTNSNFVSVLWPISTVV